MNLSELTQALGGPRRTAFMSSDRWGGGGPRRHASIHMCHSAYYYAWPNSHPSKVLSVPGSLVEVLLAMCCVFWPLCALVEVLLAMCYVFWPLWSLVELLLAKCYVFWS